MAAKLLPEIDQWIQIEAEELNFAFTNVKSIIWFFILYQNDYEYSKNSVLANIAKINAPL